MTTRLHDGEPHTILDSWPFIASGLVIACAILLLRVCGWLT